MSSVAGIFKRMRTVLVLAGLLCGSFLPSFGQQRLQTLHQYLADSTTILVAAHRSVHHLHPENSIPAFQAVLDLGVDIIETDVKVTKDGIPVLMHDKTINRTTNGTGNPEEQTLAELRQFFLKDASGQLTTEKIPTLEELLRLTKGKILIDLDMKTDHVEPVLDVIRKTGTKDQVIFFDDDVAMLKRIQQRDATYRLMPRAHSYATADSLLRWFSPAIVHIDFTFYNPAVTQLIRQHRSRVWINALGEPDQLLKRGQSQEVMTKLLANGANVIQTDEPALWLTLLTSKGLHP